MMGSWDLSLCSELLVRCWVPEVRPAAVNAKHFVVLLSITVTVSAISVNITILLNFCFYVVCCDYTTYHHYFFW